MRGKYTAKWGVQIAGMIFQTRSRKMRTRIENSEPNYWLSCPIIDKNAMCKQVRGAMDALYTPEHGKSCPTEILEAIASINAEGRPIWKSMHMQPVSEAGRLSEAA